MVIFLAPSHLANRKIFSGNTSCLSWEIQNMIPIRKKKWWSPVTFALEWITGSHRASCYKHCSSSTRLLHHFIQVQKLCSCNCWGDGQTPSASRRLVLVVLDNSWVARSGLINIIACLHPLCSSFRKTHSDLGLIRTLWLCLGFHYRLHCGAGWRLGNSR